MISLITQLYLKESTETTNNLQLTPSPSSRFNWIPALPELTEEEQEKMKVWGYTVVAIVMGIAIYAFKEKR